MTLTEKLDKYMLEHGKNKLTLSKEAGIPYTTLISFYDKGTHNVKLSTLRKLAEYLGYSIDYLTNDALEIYAEPTTQQGQRTASVPILDFIQAGIPILSEQNIIGQISIPDDMEGYCDFALYVRGDSMIGVGITEGDMVLCKSYQTPASGDIVVALIGEEETTLKYYIHTGGKCLLRAANPNYSDIELQAKTQIQGRVIKVFKNPPSFNTYRDYLSLQKENYWAWNSIVEKAINYGLKPSNIAAILDSLYAMLKR